MARLRKPPDPARRRSRKVEPPEDLFRYPRALLAEWAADNHLTDEEAQEYAKKTYRAFFRARKARLVAD